VFLAPEPGSGKINASVDLQRQAVDVYLVPAHAARTCSHGTLAGERRSGSTRLQAERFLKIALAAAERMWQALAWEVNARVAMAELDVPRARDCIAKGLSAMEGFEVPLAAWRVHATAFELHRDSGNRDLAERHLALSRETIMKLANSLPAEEPLRRTFLSAPMVRRILDACETLRLRA
jgi:hypothetical protein